MFKNNFFLIFLILILGEKFFYEKLNESKGAQERIKLFFFLVGPIIVMKYTSFFGGILNFFSKNEKFLTKDRYLISKVRRLVISKIICFCILAFTPGPGRQNKKIIFSYSRDRTAKFMLLQTFLDPLMTFFDFGELKKFFLKKFFFLEKIFFFS